jgi:hypothetical protein
LIEVLSGDDPQVVAGVGAELGLPPAACRGSASPEDKLARIELGLRRPVSLLPEWISFRPPESQEMRDRA